MYCKIISTLISFMLILCLMSVHQELLNYLTDYNEILSIKLLSDINFDNKSGFDCSLLPKLQVWPGMDWIGQGIANLDGVYSYRLIYVDEVVITCYVIIFRLSMLMYRGKDSTFLSAFIETVGCTVLCGFAMSAAQIVTLGFMTWCKTIVERFPRYNSNTHLFLLPLSMLSTALVLLNFFYKLGPLEELTLSNNVLPVDIVMINVTKYLVHSKVLSAYLFCSILSINKITI